MNIELLKDELRADEGFVSHAYRDSLGYLTIGIGRLIDERRGGGISLEEAKYLLDNDIHNIMDTLDDEIPWWRNLSDPQQRALCNMAFQMGVGGLLSFQNMLVALKGGDLSTAHFEALNSLWARQTPSRARDVAALLRKK